MLRILFYLLIIYLIYRTIKFFANIYLYQRTVRKKKNNSREIIDIDYEEVKDEGFQNDQK